MTSKAAGCLMVAGMVLASLLTLGGCATKRSDSHLALTGIVSSNADGPMEGVLVNAKRVGGTITVTVVSDKQGRYSFPADGLGPGQYAIAIRAVGYEPTQPEMATTVGQNGTEYDIKLQKTSDLADQLTSAEWVKSAPGTAAQRASLYGCTACHTATQVFRSTYDAAGWVPTLVRMWNYDPGSTLSYPVPLPYHNGPRPGDKEFAKYLSSINLSGGRTTWSFPLKTLPRPTGKGTHVIITEYDLPRADAAPHDAIMDSHGIIWYSDDRQAILGRLDPRTGQTKEWSLPVVKPGFNPGSLNLAVDHAGNVWIARLFQAAVARFDPKTGKITTWREPAKYNSVHSRTSHLAITPDDKVWFADTFNRLMNLLDPVTGHISTYPAFPNWKWSWATDEGSGGKGNQPHGHFIFGVGSDSRGWGIFADKAGGNIGVMDPGGKTVLYPTPTINSGPRELRVDSEDRVWFGEDNVAKIGMFDIKTKTFKEWTTDPTRVEDDYGAVIDKDGYVWTGGIESDFVTRLDPKTGEMTQYLLPRLDVNIRCVNVDNFTNPPSLLIGENHQAKIALIQPLP